MKRTFELGLGGISSPLTLLRNRADFKVWKRKTHADYSTDNAPFYPCLAYTVLHRDECDYAEFLSPHEAYNIAAKMREAVEAFEQASKEPNV